jgi:hypothetical protein
MSVERPLHPMDSLQAASADEVFRRLENALAVTAACLDLIGSEGHISDDLLPEFHEACSATNEAVHLLPLLRRAA